MNNQNEVTYMIVGGHGGQVFLNSWSNASLTHNLIFTTVDWGGSSGLIGRILESLGLDSVPTGDLRNNIANMLAVRFSNQGQMLEQLLQSEILNIEDVEKSFVKLLNEIQKVCQPNMPLIEIFNIDEMLRFINIYIQTFKTGVPEKWKYRLDKTLIPHKIGNLLLTALANLGGGYDKLGTELQRCGLIPNNINIFFCENRRLIQQLYRIDESGNSILIADGEDQIDNLEFPIEIDRLKAVDINTREFIDTPNLIISEILNKSKLVLIPPGSESNNYPWLFLYKDILKEKVILKFTNLFLDKKSAGLGYEVGMLEKSGLKPIYLVPETFTRIREQSLLALLGAYGIEGKVPYTHDTERLEVNINAAYPQVTPEQVKDILSRILPIMNVVNYNSEKISENAPSNAAITKKGLRHDRVQIENIINKISKLSTDEVPKILDLIKNL